MATISADREVFTLINVFTVDPENQQRMYDILCEATDIIKEFPGYLSANLHLSLDGTKVINYVQWRSEADFKAMRDHPDVQPHFAECRAIAQVNPIFCRVEFSHEAPAEA
ncbi:antibiotic biosynthesis monooxygenase family protein [Gandjariella thermophila]|uniref:Antibiotic biosynthesis monooxygenase n=1 Tax=Gandjariella thermophila TaxID=1931992 RepID=A0A4D4JCX2_9PSEU|nr:antibiotic biosynthesis monooxygenase family protein [Gandjariella thermophila]GDY31747.1 antibiotic biosynthesis monooxygenase [Gandjariella thermophila]